MLFDYKAAVTMIYAPNGLYDLNVGVLSHHSSQLADNPVRLAGLLSDDYVELDGCQTARKQSSYSYFKSMRRYSLTG